MGGHKTASPRPGGGALYYAPDKKMGEYMVAFLSAEAIRSLKEDFDKPVRSVLEAHGRGGGDDSDIVLAPSADDWAMTSTPTRRWYCVSRQGFSRPT